MHYFAKVPYKLHDLKNWRAYTNGVRTMFFKCVLLRYRITVDLDVTSVLIHKYTKPQLMPQQILGFERLIKSLFIHFHVNTGFSTSHA